MAASDADRKDNYAAMREAARKRFLSYDSNVLAGKDGVTLESGRLQSSFLGEPFWVDTATGVITLGERPADFGETLAIFDWLCDRKPDARASGEFCPVGSLPGVYVGGSGLSMTGGTLAPMIQADPGKFREACAAMGAEEVALGDMGFRLEIFPGLPMCLKFYFGDEEFSPQLTYLWDRNILRFVRYETVYYIAGCLQKRLTKLMEQL